ncbi:MAG TPA: hypothetical protein DHW49_06990 [Anaerolineae bacterium]|nr:hypothetical protein [Anaerolineae bacterium]
MESKPLDNKKHKFLVRLVIASLAFSFCSILFYVSRIFLFGPPEKKLQITENIHSNSSFGLMIVYQSDEDVDYADEIIIEGTRAYILDQSLASIDVETSIDILDISSPDEPIIENTYYYPKDFAILNMKAHGNYLYLDAEVFTILDVTDPQKPVAIWEFNIDGSIKSIVPFGNYLFLVGVRDLYIIDIANPKSIKLAKTIKNFNNHNIMEHATVKGNLLFVAGEGLYIFDISTPTNPVQIGFYGLPLGVDYFDNMVISNETAWVHGVYWDVFGDEQSHILLLDISNPYKPAFITTYDHYPFTVSNEIICFYDSSRNPYGESFHLMDFSDPKRPIELGYISGTYSSLGYPSAIIRENDLIYIYAVNYSDGINIIKYEP